MNWNTIIIVAGILLLLIAVWKEYTRTNRKRLGWRLLSTVLAVTALTCVGLPITYKVDSGKTGTDTITIVTNGYSDRQLTDSSITSDIKLAKAGIQYVPDISLYLNGHPNYHTAKIVGYGLPVWELERLPIPVIYEAPELPAGITRVHWQQYLYANQPLQITGQYNNTGTTAIKLVLEGLHTPLDSIMLSPGIHSFELSVVPKHIKTAVYHLLALKGRDTISSQPVPVYIQTATPANILILASSPDFENRFLSDWLHEHQYHVVVKSSISKNKTAVQISNSKEVSVGTLNNQLLSTFDVVIADDESLMQLSRSEEASLLNAVKDGLGIIVKTAGNSNKSFAARGFSIVQVPGNTTRDYSLQFQSATVIANLASDQWSFIRLQPAEQPLVTTKSNQCVAMCRLYGSGKLVATTLQNSFSWFLSGQTNYYATYWSLLIEKVARQKAVTAHWKIWPQFPCSNEAVRVTIMKEDKEIPIIKTSDAALFMQQDIYLPAEWKGNWWPRHAGWQNLVAGTDTLPVFVFGSQDWQAARLTASFKEQKQWLQWSLNHDIFAPQKTTHPTAIRTVPKIYFFMLFLACCSFLWIESKRSL